MLKWYLHYLARLLASERASERRLVSLVLVGTVSTAIPRVIMSGVRKFFFPSGTPAASPNWPSVVCK